MTPAPTPRPTPGSRRLVALGLLATTLAVTGAGCGQPRDYCGEVAVALDPQAASVEERLEALDALSRLSKAEPGAAGTTEAADWDRLRAFIETHQGDPDASLVGLDDTFDRLERAVESRCGAGQSAPG